MPDPSTHGSTPAPGPTAPGAASYRAAGVDYATLDAGKRLALSGALATSGLLGARGGVAVDASRGEPAFVFQFAERSLAFVLEGLGTKSVIARQVAQELGVNRFADVAYDAVAAIVNDLCCVGALPLVVNAYFATGSSQWYGHADWHVELLKGWQRACADAGATWGGGESPSLPELVHDQDIELAGSAIGAVPEGRAPILGADLASGDEIVLVASSGIHANGSSLARLVAARVESGWATTLADGRAFGEALLDPSLLYVPLVAALLQTQVPVSYLSHITGHGLLKLMRPRLELTYRISELLAVPEVLRFLVEEATMSSAAAYSTFNMGCGFAIYCRAGHGAEVVGLARGLGLEAVVGGRVEQGPRRVIVEPVGVTYTSDELRLAPQ